MNRLILASGSPRRQELLTSLRLTFETRVSNVEEFAAPGETPGDYVRRLSVEKAESVSREFPDAIVIGADTIVYIDQQILEKPKDAPDAEAMLAKLAGKTHTVFTGLAVIHASSGLRLSELDRTDVTISNMTANEIRWYVATGEPLDKAGSYAVQGIGAAFVESINGNYTNVVGLPLPLLRRMLSAAGRDLVASC